MSTLRDETLSSLEGTLKKSLEGYTKVVVLGIGNELRGDDSAGLHVSEALVGVSESVFSFSTGAAPESFTGKIKEIAPSHIILVDSAHMDEPAGCVKLIEESDVDETVFSTHSTPISELSRYLRNEIGCEVIIVGIRPKRLDLGEGLSPEVSDSVEWLVWKLRRVLRKEH